MTLEDIEAMTKEVLTPDEVSKIIGCDPNYIRVAARDCPQALGFPVIRLGHRTRIPRRAFLQFMKGEPV